VNPAPASTTPLVCSSKLGKRSNCKADTSKGVVLVRSSGDAPCLLGKTWGYDQTSVWVSDGCSAGGRRQNFSDDFRSDGLKVQFSFKYNFSSKLGG
jgi:hypothetical protein